jgi:hypothetical protein
MGAHTYTYTCAGWNGPLLCERTHVQVGMGLFYASAHINIHMCRLEWASSMRAPVKLGPTWSSQGFPKTPKQLARGTPCATTPHATGHVPHVTCHTLHVTRHTPHVTRHMNCTATQKNTIHPPRTTVFHSCNGFTQLDCEGCTGAASTEAASTAAVSSAAVSTAAVSTAAVSTAALGTKKLSVASLSVQVPSALP